MVAGSTALARVLGGKHHLSDVVVGAGVGTLIGYGVPWLHRRGGAAASSGRGTTPSVSVGLRPRGGVTWLEWSIRH